jgi:hypothetical protein
MIDVATVIKLYSQLFSRKPSKKKFFFTFFKKKLPVLSKIALKNAREFMRDSLRP